MSGSSAQAAALVSAGAWEPRTRKGCVLHLSSRSVSVSGGLIDQFTDLSPVAQHFAQTGTPRATYTAGPPSLATFDGANDYYLNNTALSGCTGGLTFGLVFKHNTIPGSGVYDYICKLRTNTNETFDFFTTGTVGYGAFNFLAKTPNAGAAARQFGGVTTLNTSYWAVLIHYNGNTNTTNSNYVTSVNGGSYLNANSNSGSAFGSLNVTAFVGSYYISGAPSVNTYFNGVLKDLVVFNYGMYDNDKQEMSNFNKWLNDPARVSL